MEPTRKLDPIHEHNTYSNYTTAGAHYTTLSSSSSSSNHQTQLQHYPQSPNHYYYGHPHTTNNKETMFEKPLTPSDVGKLNRLVIPKQHAEKYFPLNPTNTTTTTADDPSPSSSPSSSPAAAGTLLSFEDESGKCWRFRYSYWNSSQSYVLTKGWSRYVKEKRLDAGDVVFFERHVGYPDRLFIGWRRRSNSSSNVQDGSSSSSSNRVGGSGYCYAAGVQILSGYNSQPQPQLQQQDGSNLQSQGGVGFCTLLPPSSHHHPSLYQQQRDRFHAAVGGGVGTAAAAMQTQRRPNANNNNDNPKRLLRLFGVNMECEPEEIHFLNNNNNGHQTTSSSEEGSSSFSARRTQFQQQGPVASSLQLNNAVVYFDYPNYDHYNNQHQHSSDDDVNLPPQSVNYNQLRHHPAG